MTKDILIQYCDLKEEIKDIKKDIDKIDKEIDMIEKEPESDSVQGSYSDYPYICHAITIHGVNIVKKDKLHSLMERKKKTLELKCEELLDIFTQAEEFINELTDSRMRRILRYRYIDELTWVQIANRIGGKSTTDSIRMEHNRFFES